MCRAADYIYIGMVFDFKYLHLRRSGRLDENVGCVDYCFARLTVIIPISGLDGVLAAYTDSPPVLLRCGGRRHLVVKARPCSGLRIPH